MLFQNSPIELGSLPRIDDISMESLSPSYLKVSYLGTVIFFMILLAILLGIHLFAKFDILFWIEMVILSVWFLLFFLSLWHTYENFQIQGFAIRERDLTYRSGVFFRKTTVIPFNRIQHAEVKQGPIERRFNLQRLEIYSAGGEGSDLYIPGLLGKRADQLKDFIIKKVGKHEQ